MGLRSGRAAPAHFGRLAGNASVRAYPAGQAFPVAGRGAGRPSPRSRRQRVPATTRAPPPRTRYPCGARGRLAPDRRRAGRVPAGRAVRDRAARSPRAAVRRCVTTAPPPGGRKRQGSSPARDKAPQGAWSPQAIEPGRVSGSPVMASRGRCGCVFEALGHPPVRRVDSSAARSARAAAGGPPTARQGAGVFGGGLVRTVMASLRHTAGQGARPVPVARRGAAVASGVGGVGPAWTPEVRKACRDLRDWILNRRGVDVDERAIVD